ncbi:MAG: EAL domain-containing protein [Leptolyngbyaceae cyanobacterium MO_188.B28]|nr:EAL domain-containing protein [Leptolyngbyaceae cyanobacterium MO_188.B28]
MTQKSLSILLIEDSLADADLLQETLEETGETQFALLQVESLRDAFLALEQNSPDLILLDLSLPDGLGLDNVRKIHAAAHKIPLVVLTGLNDQQVALEAVRQGAQDYLVKGQIDGALLVRAMRYAIERKAMEQALFQEKELAQVTLKSIGDAVITTDVQGRVNGLNPVAEYLTGWSMEEAKELPLANVFKIVHERTRQPLENPVEVALQENRIVHITNHYATLISRTGDEFAIRDSVAPIRAKSGQVVGAVLVFTDVTEERRMAHQLSWQASHDALTGLLNRSEFSQYLKRAVNDARMENQCHVLGYLDLDHFKIVNDTCGHSAGDELLRQVTALLQTKIRKADIISRLGGDEFGLLLYQCPLENALQLAHTLCESLQKFRFAWQEHVFAIGASIGLVMVDADSPSPDSLMIQADTACYAAKNRGRNRVYVYRPDDQELAQQSASIQWFLQLSQALENNQFQLYLQKITPLGTETTTTDHYEVLLRLVDEQGKKFPPMAFIPPAERYGMMPKIDRWVVSNVFSRLAANLRRLSNPHTLSLHTINLSGASVNDDEFFDFLKDQMSFYNIPAKFVCFEITETVAISNLNSAIRLINNLREMGCRFALDDFGSGMSSLGYLKNLPVDYLKIDGSFIADIVNDPVNCAMVEAVNHMGHAMGLETIAEYVANAPILEKVKSLGVDYAQGYEVAAPQLWTLAE